MPDRTTDAHLAGWAKVELSGPKGSRKLTDLAVLPLGTRKMIPVAGLGYTHMRGSVALDDRSLPNDIEGSVRFFVFGAEPDRERLLHISRPAAGA